MRFTCNGKIVRKYEQAHPGDKDIKRIVTMQLNGVEHKLEQVLPHCCYDTWVEGSEEYGTIRVGTIDTVIEQIRQRHADVRITSDTAGILAPVPE